MNPMILTFLLLVAPQIDVDRQPNAKRSACTMVIQFVAGVFDARCAGTCQFGYPSCMMTYITNGFTTSTTCDCYDAQTDPPNGQSPEGVLCYTNITYNTATWQIVSWSCTTIDCSESCIKNNEPIPETFGDACKCH
jgi:hypothetical protein